MNYYKIGADEALQALGLPVQGLTAPPQEMSPEEMQASPTEGMPGDMQELNADAFAQFAEADKTDEMGQPGEKPPAFAKNVDKAPAWSGPNSMESGDAGTRNYQMGLPRQGSV